MTQATAADVLRVEVYADIACPWCRLGRHRLARAAAELGSEITVQQVHRPFQLDPDEPEQPRPLRQALGKKYDANTVARMISQMTALGEQEGVTFKLDSALAVNTLKAHQVLWLAGRDHVPAVQSSLLKLLFDAYFENGLDVADHGVLADLAGQAGMDASRVKTALQVGEGRDEVIAGVKAARAQGVKSVPTFVLPNAASIVGSQDVPSLVNLLRRQAAEHASHRG